MLEKVDGLILRTQDYGETHKIVTVFSQRLGKFSAIARGANRPKSKLAAITQPFIMGTFLIYLNQKGLSTIQQGELKESFRKVREDIEKTAYVAYIAELTDKILENFEPYPRMYEELMLTINWINDHKEIKVPALMYELKTYKIGGFAPIVDHCVNCLRKDLLSSFSIKEGGILCSECRPLDPQTIQIPTSLIKLLPIFLHVSLNRIGKISMNEKNELLLRQIFDMYYDKHGGFYIKSKKFLSQLDLLT